MDVFSVHEEVIADYRAFTSDFVEVRDKRIKQFVDQRFEDGVQWPDPWEGLNPSFATGGAMPDLVDAGLLHQEAARSSVVSKTSRTPAGTRSSCTSTSDRSRSRALEPATCVGPGFELYYDVEVGASVTCG